MGAGGGTRRGASVGVRDLDGGGDGLGLADAFVVYEKEGPVLVDGASDGAPELNAAEGGDDWAIEEVASVKDLVAIEEVGGPVEVVGARSGDGVYNGAGGAAVLRRITTGEDRELVDGVYAQIHAGGASGGGVGVVVDDHSVDSVGILIGAVTSVGELVAEAAIAFIGGESGSGLVGDRENAGLEGGQGGPVASVERELTDGRSVDRATEGGGGGLDGRRGSGDNDNLVKLANIENGTEGLLGANGQDNPFLQGGGESLRRDLDLVVAGVEV